MIRQHPEDTVVHFFPTQITSLLGYPRPVLVPRLLLDLCENWSKQIAIIVRGFGSEVLKPIRRRHNSRHPLKPHPRIHMPLGEWLKLTPGLSVKLNKDQVPNLQTAGIPLVHQLPLRLSVRRQIHVNLGTRPARPRLPHHPKIVLRISHHHMNGRI